MAPDKTEKREYLLQVQSVELVCYAGDLASDLRKHYYGNDIYIKGLIDINNVCRNDCLYQSRSQCGNAKPFSTIVA